MMRSALVFALWLLAATPLPAHAAPDAPEVPEAAVQRDALLRHDGRAVGHLREERHADGDVVRTRTTLTLSMRQGVARQQVRVRTDFVESRAGVPVSFERMTRAGDVRARLVGTRVGDRWRVRSERGGVHDERWLAAPPDLVFPAALARRLAAREAFAYGTLAAGDDGFVRWDLRPADAAGVWLRRRAGRTAETPVHVVEGRLLEPVVALGLTLLPEPCAGDCSDDVVDDLSPLDGLLLAAPYRIPRESLAGSIRYVVARSDGGVPDLPTTPGQEVTAGRRGAIVTVCAGCVDPASPPPPELAAYLAPDAWLQSDHPRLRAFARGAAGAHARPVRRRMDDLVAAIRAHMTGPVDYVGYASAVEALDSRGGDCTETAVLLAAAARAEGIPARIVVGVAYSSRFIGRSDVFGPHMWVQAWTGERWENFDAGLGEFGAGHIALAVGDGSPAGWQGLAARIRALRIVDAAAIDGAAAGGAAR
jgi:hypothetical protein